MEGKTNFSRRLRQFDGLTWPPYFSTDLRHCSKEDPKDAWLVFK